MDENTALGILLGYVCHPAGAPFSNDSSEFIEASSIIKKLSQTVAKKRPPIHGHGSLKKWAAQLGISTCDLAGDAFLKVLVKGNRNRQEGKTTTPQNKGAGRYLQVVMHNILSDKRRKTGDAQFLSLNDDSNPLPLFGGVNPDDQSQEDIEQNVDDIKQKSETLKQQFFTSWLQILTREAHCLGKQPKAQNRRFNVLTSAHQAYCQRQSFSWDRDQRRIRAMLLDHLEKKFYEAQKDGLLLYPFPESILYKRAQFQIREAQLDFAFKILIFINMQNSPNNEYQFKHLKPVRTNTNWSHETDITNAFIDWKGSEVILLY